MEYRFTFDQKPAPNTGGNPEAWLNARLANLQREQMRLAQIQTQQIEEQSKLSARLDKHEEWLKKHDEEIRQLKIKMRRCEATYADMRQRLENLDELYEIVYAELAQADRAGDNTRKKKALREILTLDNQIASARAKQSKAKADWNTARRKLVG